MADLLLAKPTPSASVDSKADWMLLIDRNSYPSVEELARPELRIARLRINPNNFAPSRQLLVINNFTLKNIKTNQRFQVSGLPSPLLAGAPSWSPDERKIVFTQTNANNVDLYEIDVATHKAAKINKKLLNVVLGNGITWEDNNTVLYRIALKPASAAPAKPLMPKEPTVQQNLGKAAPSATYEDLIKSPYDEQLFEFYATTQLVRNKNGVETAIGKPAIYTSVSISPDKKYLLERTIRKPFSYLVTAAGFPSTVTITDLAGKTLKMLAELPSREATPSGYDNTQNVPRGFDWRDDEAATITWAQPLDSGLIRRKVDFHDAVYALNAPFTGTPKELFKTQFRFRGVTWGNKTVALVSEGLRSKQTDRISRYNSTTGALEKLLERNQTDAYSDPGNPVTEKNKFGREVIQTTDNGTKILMNNIIGSSSKGDLPFLTKFDLATKQNQIIWRCSEGTYEFVVDVVDPDKLIVITRKESQKEVPNYYLKDFNTKLAGKVLTNFSNPYPQMIGVSRQKIAYKRSDGVDLTGDLYLPAGYDKAKDGPLPALIWAYPREFNSAADAAQVRGSANRFTTIDSGSPVFFVTNGYAVLDNAEMPIVAKDGKKPNDTFVEQL